MFIVTGSMALSSMISLPWFEFVYDQSKAINWANIKSVLFDFHYASMLLALFYAGLCCSFQAYLEFWYLDRLQASPLLMGFNEATINRGFSLCIRKFYTENW